MPKDHEAPSLALKANVRRFKMKLPMLGLDDQEVVDKSANGNKAEGTSLAQIDQKLQEMYLHLEHESFRK